VLECYTLELAIGPGKGCRTGRLGVAEMPDDPTTNDRGQIHFVSETVTVLLIGQEICRERQATAGQHGDEPLLNQSIDHSGRVGIKGQSELYLGQKCAL
jgi:hypothetical protein